MGPPGDGMRSVLQGRTRLQGGGAPERGPARRAAGQTERRDPAHGARSGRWMNFHLKPGVSAQRGGPRPGEGRKAKETLQSPSPCPRPAASPPLTLQGLPERPAAQGHQARGPRLREALQRLSPSPSQHLSSCRLPDLSVNPVFDRKPPPPECRCREGAPAFPDVLKLPGAPNAAWH